jgi:hypothetical protein
LKAFRDHAFRDVMAHLRTKGFAFDLDVLLLARALRLRIEEIPVDVRIDSGRSSVRLARDGAIRPERSDDAGTAALPGPVSPGTDTAGQAPVTTASRTIGRAGYAASHRRAKVRASVMNTVARPVSTST